VQISQDLIAFVTTPAVHSSAFDFDSAPLGKVKEVNILGLFALEKDVFKVFI
jgi:hypothetical protein